MSGKSAIRFWARLGLIAKKVAKRGDRLTPPQDAALNHYTQKIHERSRSTLNFLVDQEEFRTLVSTTDLPSSLRFAYSLLIPPMSDLISLFPKPGGVFQGDENPGGDPS